MSTEDSKYNLFNNVMNNLNKVNPLDDVAIMNKRVQSAIVQTVDGVINNINGLFSQSKGEKEEGIKTDISLHSNTITVQKDIIANDISINYHKLNSQLYELTNMKQVMDTSVGNLTMMGTVLVKTYEPTLKKWVLMRRQVRIPMFSNLLDTAVVDDRLELDLEDSMDKIINYKIENDNNENNED